jgi:type I pantothenate kinase
MPAGLREGSPTLPVGFNAMSDPNSGAPGSSPFVEIERAAWAELAPSTQLPLTPEEVVGLRGLGDMLEVDEVSDVYLPLSKLINLYAVGAQQLHTATSAFLGERSPSTPFVIGVAGSVAVGKSTIARLLRVLLSRWDTTPRVALLTTDGFLLPNAELERRGLMQRKGFPESYDRRGLLRFVTQVKSGVDEVRAPVYSHLTYDIVPDAPRWSCTNRTSSSWRGSTCCSRPTTQHRLAVSDLFDFSVYVDARTSDIATWYEERFLKLQRSAFSNPEVLLPPLCATLTEADARQHCPGHLGPHQRAEPDPEHPPHALPCDRGTAQGFNSTR